MFVFLVLDGDELVVHDSRTQNFFDTAQFELQIFRYDRALQIHQDCKYQFQRQKDHFHGHIFPLRFQKSTQWNPSVAELPVMFWKHVSSRVQHVTSLNEFI